ncbi:MAG: ribulose-phosphate 3-epimerase [Planctomycetota bacterium]|jgi:D-allulose-6-phosphate 3-epimerase|nr:ribulose-phosphate 3-epimerase [Planctomycetota bacterium]
MKTQIAASLMCMDLMQIREQLDFFEKRIHFHHVDIMDGHFVPNLTLSPYFIGQIKPYTQVPIDAHLMVTTPGNLLASLAEAGTDYISLHVETLSGVGYRNIKTIKDLGKKVGLVLNPETTLESVRHYLNLADKVTLMTVDPGFAAQPFIPEMLDKIRELADWKRKHGWSLAIEVDGSCNRRTYVDLLRAGAEVLVMGSTGLFGLNKDLGKAWDAMCDDLTRAEGEAGL